MTTFKQLSNEPTSIQATIHTTLGDITVNLFEEVAPKAVENFIGLAKKGYYDGVIFHRIINDFMVQGGDPTGTGAGGESFFGQPFEDEFSVEAFNLHGALSMANAGPNTNGSQFFIVTASQVPDQMLSQLEGAGFPQEIIDAYKENGGTPWLDGRHTVFGHVVDGMDVVESMEDVPTNSADKPDEDIVIESIEIKE